MLCDRIRVAATVCNETENYGSVDRGQTPQPSAGEGAGQHSGAPRTAPGSAGTNPGQSPPRLSGDTPGPPYLRFWYQVLTCVSVRLRAAAKSMRSCTLRYFCRSKLRSSWLS